MSPFSLKILIVEDNLSFALELQMLLEELGYTVLDRVDNSTDAFRVIQEKQPDLILMDIDIKGNLSGIEIGNRIKHLEIPILYITSYKDGQHYAAAQESNMIGYMVKPVEKISLKTTIQLSISKAYALKNHNLNTPSIENNIVHKDYFFFKHQDAFQKVYIKDIAFVKSNDNYCESHTHSGQTFMARIGISQLEKMLSPKLFMRIHRQYIVQVSCINSINFNSNFLKINTNELPFSRAKRKTLAALLKPL
ncbi:MAG: LytR/AlgR family response regulator transcription factor [Chitinophagales bacterium]